MKSIAVKSVGALTAVLQALSSASLMGLLTVALSESCKGIFKCPYGIGCIRAFLCPWLQNERLSRQLGEFAAAVIWIKLHLHVSPFVHSDFCSCICINLWHHLQNGGVGNVSQMYLQAKQGSVHMYRWVAGRNKTPMQGFISRMELKTAFIAGVFQK